MFGDMSTAQLFDFNGQHPLCMRAAKLRRDCTFVQAGIQCYLPLLRRTCIHALWHKHFNPLFSD